MASIYARQETSMELEKESLYWNLQVLFFNCFAIITHADGCRVSIALIRLCDSVCHLSVSLSVCPHVKNQND